MGQYRIHSIAELARQMHFAPIARRLEQLNSTEELLLKLSPDRAYALSEITCAITGYEPRDVGNESLAGVALQHDLGLLLEEVSESLQLHVNSCLEPVLMIEEVAQRLGVTTKTVQRWRRRGLPARRYTFADNKRRIGFRHSSVQRFVGSGTAAADDVMKPNRPPRSLQWLVARAGRLASKCYGRLLASQRLSRAAGISAIALDQILREHAPTVTFAAEASSETRSRIIERREAGESLALIARSQRISIFEVYRTILEQQLTHIIRKRIAFHDDPLYHGENAAEVIEAILTQETTEPADPQASRPARDIPPYLRDLYRIEPLSAARERGLFLKYHYLRYLAVRVQKDLDTQTSRHRDLRRFEKLRRHARLVRGQIVEANLRLVVSVARKHVRPSIALMDLVSEGNLTLMRAVDSFDIHRGTRFSTYAVYALMRGFARYVPATLNTQQTLADPEHLREIGDPASQRPAEHTMARDEVVRLMAHLDSRERQVLAGRFGLNSDNPPLSTRELGSLMKVSSQRIAQIERDALTKLRALAATADGGESEPRAL